MTKTAQSQMARNTEANRKTVSAKANADRLREYSRKMRAARRRVQLPVYWSEALQRFVTIPED